MDNLTKNMKVNPLPGGVNNTENLNVDILHQGHATWGSQTDQNVLAQSMFMLEPL